MNLEEMKSLPEDNQKELFERLSGLRGQGKTASYACAYGGGAGSISKGAGIPLSVAKSLHEAYWKLHWSVTAISEEQVTFKCKKGLTWLINPITGFCYNIRTEKDIFSTLCQGTGSFLFDMWVKSIQETLYKDFGAKTLTATYHDEVVFCLKDNEKAKEYFTKVIEGGIVSINSKFKLRREMGCDVQFGKRYSEIH